MNNLKSNIISIYGDKGEEWLKNLPDIISQIASKHKLEQLTPSKVMNFNYIIFGHQNSEPIVLKVSLDNVALSKEYDYLTAVSNQNNLKIIAHDKDMIIMEQALPGTTLKEQFPKNDKEATTILCSLIKKLHTAHIPKNHNFKNIKDILKVLDKDINIPQHILLKARNLRDNLLAATTQEVLLHGDLHHENILKHNNEWVAIDPKGFIGDPAFEVAGYLYNPIPDLVECNNAQEIIKERIKLCSELLQIPQQTIHDWMYVKIVLCWAWNLEDNSSITYWEKIINDII
ncbi:aminoglycoside phosphotransferase family protein [Candidatus Babeliales bacterium]|nr:aminoglycoside phosphotransferase family protein [Candidatus Babeliales bacterium]